MIKKKKAAYGGLLINGDAASVLQKLPLNSFDLIISSPPYNIGKIYERSERLTFDQYIDWQDNIIRLLIERLSPKGSICWQVGNFVKDGESFPLDMYFYESFKKRGMHLRNRIIWTFNFGLHAQRRFSGRYETILWFTKSDKYRFNLDPVRIPQLYPGKRHSKHKGINGSKPSGNPLGKNPADIWEFSAEEHLLNNPIWEIPNVKANHPEKTEHPCQFPVELVERCLLALTNPGDLVLDPFVGTGTTMIAALKNNRRVVGIEKDASYARMAEDRLSKFKKGTLKLRPAGREIAKPKPTDKVAQMPKEWLKR